MTFPNRIKQQIADIVHSVIFPNPEGGSCYAIAQLGRFVLGELGIESQLKFGSLMYRVGPNPNRDTLMMGHPITRKGFVGSNGYLIGHVWTETDCDTIDFSPNSWQKADEACMRIFGTPPMHWSRPAPDFIWRNTAGLPKMRDRDVPNKGEYWFGSWDGEIPILPDENASNPERLEFLQHVIDASDVRNDIARMR